MKTNETARTAPGPRGNLLHPALAPPLTPHWISKMRVLMLGWEFPPHLSGGLGTACLGLTRALANLSTEITFVLPAEASDEQAAHLRLLGAAPAPGVGGGPAASATPAPDHGAARVSASPAPGVAMHAVPSGITTPYPDGGEPLPTPEGLRDWLNNPDGSPLPTAPPTAGGAPAPVGARDPYAGDLLAESNAYANRCVALAKTLDFDVIHAHDWPTFPAAAAVSAATGKPWIAHVHSLESDRAGGVYQVNPQIDAIERGGIRGANAVIAVSRRTGDLILETCSIPPHRVSVIYNGIDLFDAGAADAVAAPGTQPVTPPTLPDERSKDEKIVLFLGRITAQKGPSYFLDAAKRVLEKFSDVRFVVAGTGDQSHELVARASELGISDHMLFTGFLGAEDVDRVFRIADLYVMPSVSEPFGIAPLEAIQHDVPVIISRQSGVSEVLEHVLKVDFWDTDDLANKILAVLRNPPLAQTLRDNAGQELRRLNWREAAEQCVKVYTALGKHPT